MKKILLALTTILAAGFAQAQSETNSYGDPMLRDFDLSKVGKPTIEEMIRDSDKLFLVSDDDDIDSLNDKYRFYQEGDREREEMFLVKKGDSCDGKVKAKPGIDRSTEKHIRDITGPALRDLDNSQRNTGKVDLGIGKVKLEGRLQWCRKT